MNKIIRMLATMACAALAAAGSNALAQDYPARPVKWIVPYLAGTAPDNSVRIVSESMAKVLGQPIVVDNRGGVAGNIGAGAAAKAPADGYTLVYSGSPMATNMRMYRNPGFDVMKDFIHVGRITQSDSVIIVGAASPITSVKDLLDQMRKNPGKLSFASGGVGTPSHMGAELLLAATKTQALHVPFKGASESVTAVLGKQVDFAIALVGAAAPQITAGKLRPLAVLSPRRNALLQSTPTLAEAGVPGVELVSFGGLSVPKGTPAPIVAKLRDALARTLQMPDVRARLEANGGTMAPSTPEEFTEALHAEIGLTEKMMRAAKIEPQ